MWIDRDVQPRPLWERLEEEEEMENAKIERGEEEYENEMGREEEE